MSIFLQNYVSLTEGSRDVALPSLFNGQWVVGHSENFSASITTMQAVIWIVTFLAMLALTICIRYSRMGRACRACAEDLKMASLLGINTDRVIALTCVIGAAMAAVAGVLLGQLYGVINPYLGFMAGMKAFTAAVLGGIGSIPGAMIGGLILGIAEALSSAGRSENGEPAWHQHRPGDCADLCDWRGDGGGGGCAARSVLRCD